ncbi:unnamed protein product [Dracunculus medinensis]|uniref:FLYWCH-type domain-containing protein n=1 Tax=Dracunculus medinensis TaxID=318479 RepID=A0A0N4UP61_DRAME|nr:unnamed protein product [Dracunculus medinensis]
MGDFGEPTYVQAHGGKNDVILYRSRTNPDLAIEFFFRSSSKDGRSRYYRCTNCWYLYKQNRGTCATLIVRDGRIITDPENPVVPHQCNFKTMEAVTANRSWIANRKRRSKMELMKLIFGRKAPENGNKRSNNSKERPSGPLSDSLISSVNTSTNLLENMSRSNSQGSSDSESSNCADTSPRSSTFTSIIDAAFSHSMKNEYEQALSQLKIAYELKEPFDVDDVSLVDNVFACRLNAASDPQQKLTLCEEWLDFLLTLTLPQVISSRWLAPYQFSIYYCFHLGYLLFRQVADSDKKKFAFYELAKTFYVNIMDVVNNLSEPADEIVILKLDILIAISYLYGQYYDVSDGYLGIFAKEQLTALHETLPPNLSEEVMNSVTHKTIRVNKNLDEGCRAFCPKQNALESCK